MPRPPVGYHPGAFTVAEGAAAWYRERSLHRFFFSIAYPQRGSKIQIVAIAFAHVVHFDRWWNPAVEERIDRLIESKRALSRDLLEGGAELLLTEMKDAELLDLVALDLVALDINAALKEA